MCCIYLLMARFITTKPQGSIIASYSHTVDYQTWWALLLIVIFRDITLTWGIIALLACTFDNAVGAFLGFTKDLESGGVMMAAFSNA